MKISIVYNASLAKIFEPFASSLKKEFESIDILSDIYTNSDILKKDNFDFNDCVFLDKDITCGLLLEAKGIRLYNNVGAIETCDDKSKTYIALKDFYELPETIIVPYLFNDNDFDADDYSNYLIEKLGLPLIIKKAKSSLGEGVFLVKSKKRLKDILIENINDQLIACKYIEESCGKDVRAYVVGDKVVAAMERYNKKDFRSNIALGGKGTPFVLNDEEEKLCLNIARSLGLDFCGIDLLFKNDRPNIVCEVNSNALIYEIDKVCNVNIPKHIAEHIKYKAIKASSF